ncbi:MAG: PQQ-binding-like beta-propeller repeat protein [Bacteroidales bacterium]|nr:PQQ-binding-like beta-propeller repeat protein [Bacteroidales bacterium]
MKTIKFAFPSVLIIALIYFLSFISKPVEAKITEDEVIIKVHNDSIDSLIIDVTEQYIKLNSDKKYKPSNSFRPGHVSATQISNYLKKTDYGYVINLGKNTNIPTPAVKNGVVYVSGGFGSKQYYAFDAKSGQNIWAVNLDDDGPSSPAIRDSIIVFNTESCTIFACNIKTGEQIWSWWMGDPLMSMPTIAGNIVFSAYPSGMNAKLNIQSQGINFNQKNEIITTGNSQLINDTTISINTSHVFVAFDLHTGEIIWQNRIDGDVMSAPVAKDEFVYVTTFPGTLFKFNQKTGEIISVKAMRATSAPMIVDGNIFISKRSDSEGENVSEGIVSFNFEKENSLKEHHKKYAPYLDKTVQERTELKTASVADDAGNGFAGGAPSNSGWYAANENVGQSNVSSLQSFQGSRTLNRDGKNYNTMGDVLICTDSRTGKVIWEHEISGDMTKSGGFMGTPPLSVSDYIIIATYSGKVIISDKNTGKEIETYDIKEPIRYQPVADKGWIFVTSANGKLHAINTGNKKITGWSHWGANAGRTNESD